MVKCIRNIEKLLGDGIKRPTISELKNKDIIRKSIVASCDIKKNEKFTVHNISTKRPGFGITPMLWESVLNNIANKDYKKDDLIDL